LRKSTFQNYFFANPKLENENLRHKFREVNQFLPQGLANHLEIKNGNSILEKNYRLLYFQSYKKPLLWYKLNFNFFRGKNRKLFMCLQSLDQCPPKKLKYILNWLKNRLD